MFLTPPEGRGTVCPQCVETIQGIDRKELVHTHTHTPFLKFTCHFQLFKII